MDPSRQIDRLFEAADQLLAMRTGHDGAVPTPTKIATMIRQGSVALAGFSCAELLEARAMLVRMGFAAPVDMAAKLKH